MSWYKREESTSTKNFSSSAKHSLEERCTAMKNTLIAVMITKIIENTAIKMIWFDSLIDCIHVIVQFNDAYRFNRIKINRNIDFH